MYQLSADILIGQEGKYLSVLANKDLLIGTLQMNKQSPFLIRQHFVIRTIWAICHLGHNDFLGILSSWARCLLGILLTWAFCHDWAKCHLGILTLGILSYLGILSPWAFYHRIQRHLINTTGLNEVNDWAKGIQ